MKITTLINGQPIEKVHEKKPQFVISLDLGQTTDFTAITVIEIIEKNRFDIRHLERLPLGTSYIKQTEYVKELYDELRKVGYVRMGIDMTGIGRAVYDQFRDNLKITPIGITISGNIQKDQKDGNLWTVSKRNLVGALLVAFQNGNIRIARGLPEAKILEQELLNFKMKISTSGHDTYEAWRENEHDDMVLSAAIGVYLAQTVADSCVLHTESPVNKYTTDRQGIDPFREHRRKYR